MIKNKQYIKRVVCKTSHIMNNQWWPPPSLINLRVTDQNNIGIRPSSTALEIFKIVSAMT